MRRAISPAICITAKASLPLFSSSGSTRMAILSLCSLDLSNEALKNRP